MYTSIQRQMPISKMLKGEKLIQNGRNMIMRGETYLFTRWGSLQLDVVYYP